MPRTPSHPPATSTTFREHDVGDAVARRAVHRALLGPGRRLDPEVREAAGHRLGHDFSRVRIHDDPLAAEAALLLGARAFTVGQDVVFGASHHGPRSSTGRRLLLHELAHTIQQEEVRGAGGAPAFDPPDGHLDEEAERAASGRGHVPVLGRLSAPTLQRQTGGEQAFDLSLTYPPAHTEHHHALAPAVALTVLTRFANRIEVHVEGAHEGHRHLHEIHEDQWIVAGISDVLGGRSIPSLDIWSWPRSLLRLARASIARGAILEAARELQMAAHATRAAERRVYEYREGTIAGAERAVFGLEVVQVASAAVVTVGTGGTAGILAGAGLAGAQRLAGEATAVHLGLEDEIDWAGVAFDTISAAVTGRLAGRLGSALAARLAARIGSQLTASAMTAVIVGRASGVVHAGTRELFDALRGRTNLTVEQFIDRLADQLTLRAAFLDLVGHAAGSTTPRAARPESAPPRSPSTSPRLRVEQGGVPGRVAMRGGRVLSAPVSSPASSGGGVQRTRGSAALARETLPAAEIAPPSVQEVPAPAPASDPAHAALNAPSPSTASFAGVAIAASGGSPPAPSPPPVAVRLELPLQKKMHAPMYESLVRSRALEHTPGQPRKTAQRANWDRALRPGGAMQMDLESWVGLEQRGVPPERALRPDWSSLQPRVDMEVDHRVEWQLLGAADRSWGDSMPNYELLDQASNGSAGSTLRANIARERESLATTTGNPSWLTQPIRFTQLVLPPGTPTSMRWLPEEIQDGAHYRAYLAHERRGLR